MKHYYSLILRIIALLLFWGTNASAQFYQENPSFKTLEVKKFEGHVSGFLKQPDNKILILGGMDYINSTERNLPARLNENGTLDETFNLSVYGSWWPLAIRSDGKKVLFHEDIGADGQRYVRLSVFKEDGEEESSYLTDIKTTGVGVGEFLAVQNDHKMVVSSLFLNESSVYKGIIKRFNMDGTVDNSFSIGDLDITWLYKIKMQPDGKLIAIGSFILKDGTERRLIRLNSDGSLDAGFIAATANKFGHINVIEFQKDGKILLGLDYEFVRLLPSGETDDSFFKNYFPVHSVVVQPDDKILVGSWIPDDINYREGYGPVFRLNADGTKDENFNTGIGAIDSPVNALMVQTDGNILAGGSFSEFNYFFSNGIVRLSGVDGQIDPSFNLKLETRGRIENVLVQEDGKALVFGDFNSANDQNINDLTRLNADGTQDNSFLAGAEGFGGANNGFIRALIIQKDHKLLAGGFFTSYNGTAANSFIRLNSDGSVDNSFQKFGHEKYFINTIAEDADGNIWVGGNGDYPNFYPLVVKLLPDGNPDPGFTVSEENSGFVKSIIVQEDGKAVVGGDFTSFNKKVVRHFIRLNLDGSVDETFKSTGSDFRVNKILKQEDGKLLVSGDFSSFNNVPVKKLIRLHPDGTLDPSFDPDLGGSQPLYDFSLQPDGQILISGSSVGTYANLALLKEDGSRTEAFFFLNFQYGYAGMAPYENKLYVCSLNKLFQAFNLQKQEITFNPVPDKQAGDAPFTLEATASSGLPVTFTLDSGPASVDGNTVTLTGAPGTVTIRASQAGDDYYGMAEIKNQSFEVLDPLGTKNNRLTGIKIYPNPAMDYIYVDSLVPVGKTDIQLFDLMGKKVYTSVTSNSSGLRIDCQNMPRGMYFLHLLNGNKTYSQKVILK